MTECYITLRGDRAEAFETVKARMGPPEADVTNTEAVMRLVEAWREQNDGGRPEGGLRKR